MINMDPKEFDQLYGDAFKKLHPETKLELVQRNSYRSINDNITRLQPDIIFNIAGLDYNEAVKSGYLMEIVCIIFHHFIHIDLTCKKRRKLSLFGFRN